MLTHRDEFRSDGRHIGAGPLAGDRIGPVADHLYGRRPALVNPPGEPFGDHDHGRGIAPLQQVHDLRLSLDAAADLEIRRTQPLDERRTALAPIQVVDGEGMATGQVQIRPEGIVAQYVLLRKAFAQW